MRGASWLLLHLHLLLLHLLLLSYYWGSTTRCVLYSKVKERGGLEVILSNCGSSIGSRFDVGKDVVDGTLSLVCIVDIVVLCIIVGVHAHRSKLVVQVSGRGHGERIVSQLLLSLLHSRGRLHLHLHLLLLLCLWISSWNDHGRSR